MVRSAIQHRFRSAVGPSFLPCPRRGPHIALAMYKWTLYFTLTLR